MVPRNSTQLAAIAQLSSRSPMLPLSQPLALNAIDTRASFLGLFLALSTFRRAALTGPFVALALSSNATVYAAAPEPAVRRLWVMGFRSSSAFTGFASLSALLWQLQCRFPSPSRTKLPRLSRITALRPSRSAR